MHRTAHFRTTLRIEYNNILKKAQKAETFCLNISQSQKPKAATSTVALLQKVQVNPLLCLEINFA